MVRTEIALADALPFLQSRLERSRLVRWMGVDRLSAECGNISLMTSQKAPQPNQDFYSGFGESMRAPNDWLTDYAVAYLKASPNGLVLFEDLVSSASDTCLTTRSHPHYWHFEGTLFWPATSSRADHETVKQSKNWAAAINEIVIFAKIPASLDDAVTTRQLVEQEVNEIAGSITEIATDICDSEGFMLWQRRSG